MNKTLKCGIPIDVLGEAKKMPSAQTLYKKSKYELIDMLFIAQVNYGSLLNLYERINNINDAMYTEAIEKGIDFECLKIKDNVKTD